MDDGSKGVKHHMLHDCVVKAQIYCLLSERYFTIASEKIVASDLVQIT